MHIPARLAGYCSWLCGSAPGSGSGSGSGLSSGSGSGPGPGLSPGSGSITLVDNSHFTHDPQVGLLDRS